MNKRQKKKLRKKKIKKLAYQLLEALGIELGESHARYAENLMK